MNTVRGVAFNVAFYTWTVVLAILAIPVSLHRPSLRRASLLWAMGSVRMASVIAGIRLDVIGRANLPPAPYIVAAKHQSAWDIMGLLSLFPDAVFVVKRELSWIPVFGWLLMRVGHIPVDRSAGAAAMRAMQAAARDRAKAGFSLLVFPQGTRTGVRTRAPYLRGVAGLYSALGLPVVPVALNSGVFWPRRRLSLRPGRLVVEILPPIGPGLGAREFIALLEQKIEASTEHLVANAEAGNEDVAGTGP